MTKAESAGSRTQKTHFADDETLAHIAALELEAADLRSCIKDLRERLAELTMSLGFATGHGDTAADILKELEWQIEERLAKARAEAIEECARVCDRFASRNMHPAECAGAIRELAHPKGEDHGNG